MKMYLKFVQLSPQTSIRCYPNTFFAVKHTVYRKQYYFNVYIINNDSIKCRTGKKQPCKVKNRKSTNTFVTHCRYLPLDCGLFTE